MQVIFDVGMHTGVDTAFYLSKGFRVVGIEANRALCDAARERFATEIAEGRLVIEACGVHEVPGEHEFFVNRCDEWSSFHAHLGSRMEAGLGSERVTCHRLDHFIAKHGVPYYLKIDVEGLDNALVRQLALLPSRPRYLSVEDGGLDTLLAVYATGARRFKFSDQIAVRDLVAPEPPLEGRFAPWGFGLASSGPFGEELPGDWMGPDEAFWYYTHHVRPKGVWSEVTWWDIHACYA